MAAACSKAQTVTEQGSIFGFMHLSDTHICRLEGAHPQRIQKRQRCSTGYKLSRRELTPLTQRVGTDTVLITGDLVDSWEIESAEGDLRTDRIEGFASAWIRQIECFHEGTYCFKDIQVGATPRLYFLDNGYCLDDDPIGNPWDVAQLHWLENELDKTPDRKAILYFRIPLPVGDTNGDGMCFKKPPEGWLFPDTYERGIFKILNQRISVVAAFAGHCHKNVIEDIPLPAEHAVTQVETGSFALNTDNWRVIEIGRRKVSISKPGSTDVERVVEFSAAFWEKTSPAPCSEMAR